MGQNVSILLLLRLLYFARYFRRFHYWLPLKAWWDVLSLILIKAIENLNFTRCSCQRQNQTLQFCGNCKERNRLDFGFRDLVELAY